MVGPLPILFAGNPYEDAADDLVGSIPQLREGMPVKGALLGARRRPEEEEMRSVFEHVVTKSVAADERGHDPERISFTKVLKEARRTVIQQAARTLAMAAHHAMDIADNLRRYVNPERQPRASERTLKRIRARNPPRPAIARGKPVTTKTPPKPITLRPRPAN